MRGGRGNAHSFRSLVKIKQNKQKHRGLGGWGGTVVAIEAYLSAEVDLRVNLFSRLASCGPSKTNMEANSDAEQTHGVH